MSVQKPFQNAKIFFLSTLFLLSACSKVQVADLSSELDTGNAGLGNGVRTATISLKPQAQASKLDLLLVIDDSGSMKPDSLALASKLEGFIRKLEANSLDWQMCLTSTDTLNIRGGSILWSGTSSNVLAKGTPNLNNIIVSTIDQMSFGNSGDERGIAAMIMHLQQMSHNHCYRPGAALSVILISDEDERSVGGDITLNRSQYVALDNNDQPETYISLVQSQLKVGMSPVAHTVHSIIIKPQDQSCLAEQNNQGYPGFVGTYYHKLSSLTGGTVGSICSKDYSVDLSVAADQITKSLQRVKLECAPAPGYKVTTSPALANIKTTVDGDYIIIESQLSQETLVNIQYTCQ